MMVAKKLYRFLRAGNIQIYHLRNERSDSERRGAQQSLVMHLHVAPNFTTSENT